MNHGLSLEFRIACNKPFDIFPNLFSKSPKISYALVPKDIAGITNGVSKPFIVRKGSI